MRNKTAFILILSLFAAGAACRKSAPAAGAPAAAPPGSEGRIVLPPDSALLDQIKVEAVGSAELPESEVSAPGRIEFDIGRVGRIHLPVPGRVEAVLVKLGDAVAAGQPVLTIDSPDADAAVSGYRQAVASIAQARSTSVRAMADRDRALDLFEHKAAAKKDVLAAENDLVLAQAAVDQAEAARDQAERRLKILGLDAREGGSRVTVGAPLAGKVIELSVTAGEYRSDTTVPVVTIADLSVVWVTSDIPETSIRLIEAGERVQVELVAFPGEVFEARVTRIADTVDPGTRTVQVRAELANPAGRLRPEMFGRIRHFHTPRPTPVVPAGAVLRRGPVTAVYIERRRGEFERVPVSLGASYGGLVAVPAGIKAGDRVVVGGVMLLAGMESR